MYWRHIHKYWYLIIASAAILLATTVLLVMQYRSIQRTEAQSRAIAAANLELHLLEMVDDARRDTLDHAGHILHSIRQQRVRDRNVPSIERAFTRSLRRYDELQNFYVVFFDRGKESETWKALTFVPPDENDPNTQTYEGAPVGRLVEDREDSESLHRAWDSVPKHSQTTLYSAFDPVTKDNGHPRQFFFHTVFELDRLKRTTDLECVGLLVFSADPDSFPSSDYLNKLVARYEKRDKQVNELLGTLTYSIALNEGDAKRDLIGTSGSPGVSEITRTRKFDTSSGLFPNLSFTVSPKSLSGETYNNGSQLSIFLGVGAAMLSFVGLGLTWRATRREMKVAQLKSDFLANISHELKTPLTAIRAFGDLMQSGRVRDSERIREYGDIIMTESDRLTALINNILEMSRLERGIRRYRLETGDLGDAVADTVEMFRHSSDAVEYKIAVEIPPVPIKTKFDENAVRQALLNLLSNAVKYSGENDEYKQIAVVVKSEKNDALIEVTDSGIGIAAADQSQIFQAFHRAAPEDIKAKGSGLGLAIVREIARAHGGDISVESALGKGSIFTLRLPILNDDASLIAEKRSNEAM